MTGTSHSASQIAETRKARADRRPRMLGQFGAEQAFIGRCRPRRHDRRRPETPSSRRARATKPMMPAAITISGNGTAKKKMPIKASAASASIGRLFKRAAADPLHRLQHDRQHRRLQPEKQRRDRRHAAEGGVDVAERHDRDDAGQHEQAAGDDRARPAMHQPADIDRQLMRFGAGQQHAVAQRMQKPALADPFLLVDDDAVHDRDLSGRAAEAERGDAQPDPERFAERDAVAMLGGPSAGGERGVRHRPDLPCAGDARILLSPEAAGQVRPSR